MAEKTAAQTRADWITHGNIARVQAQLDRESHEGKRKILEALLVEQRKLIAPD